MDRLLGNLQLSVLLLQVDASGFVTGVEHQLLLAPLLSLWRCPCRCRSSCRIEAAVWLPRPRD
uniref:DUF3778 domain-containing protein n=1 Tax=Oryza punctata TaxID=4537 RepID=A0A0E0KHG3_ORYPU